MGEMEGLEWDEMEPEYDEDFDDVSSCPYGIGYVEGSEHCEFCEYLEVCPER